MLKEQADARRNRVSSNFPFLPSIIKFFFVLFQVREAHKRREERIATKKQELLQSYAKKEEQQVLMDRLMLQPL